MAGRTPLQVWQTATTLRRAAPDELLFLMQSRGVYKVGPNGVKVNVGGQRISYGVSTPALYRYIGRDVFITLDPSELSRCKYGVYAKIHRFRLANNGYTFSQVLAPYFTSLKSNL